MRNRAVMPSPSSSPPRRPPVLAPSRSPLRCDALAGLAIRAARVDRAVDRPDRLEVDVLPSATWAGGLALEPRGPIALDIGDACVFEGSVERVAYRADARGAMWSVVAWPDWEFRRGLRSRDVYYEMTDAEIAQRIARELGLAARVDPGGPVHERVLRVGDPLRFLRARAVAAGVEFAVTAGALHFGRGPLLAAAGRSRISPADGVIELEVEDRGPEGRCGRCELVGGAHWRPLVACELVGVGTIWEGAYRVLRVSHRFDAAGVRTRLEFQEDGIEPVPWQDEDVP